MKRSINEYDEGRGGGLRKAAEIGAFTAGGAGLMAGPIKVASLTGQKVADDKKSKADREAASEMKRESRGVPKPTNFDAIEEAKQEVKDAADRKKISDMGHKKGGVISSASSRADGIATKGKTRGKFV